MQNVAFRIAVAKSARLIAFLIALILPMKNVFGQPYGINTRPLVGAFLNGNLPPAPQSALGWQVVPAFPNLAFDDPVTLVAEPRTNRLYVCERQGKIFFFQNQPTTTSKTLFLDLTAATQGYDDCGLIGLAFHPEFGVAGSTNRGYVYVYYQFSESPTSGPNRPPSATPGFNRLSRFTVPNGSLVANRASELILINQYDRHVWHNGGGMFFGPDGFLYLSNGDEGAANDSYNQSQKINSGLFSGVLRIDVDRDSTRSHPIRRQPVSVQPPPAGWTNVTFSAHYFIPNDNPWVNTNGTWLEEFYAIGLRSPHRMTYDPPTDRIWAGDVGQGTREEVDIIEKGGNYQWAYREGTVNGPKTKPNPLIGVDKPPVYDYGRAAGDTCVIGGYVYRGLEHADTLYGKYIFGDNTSGRIWSMTYDGTNPPVVVELLDTGWPNNYQGLSGFGVDNNNELYLCKMGRPSAIYKLARTGSQPPAPPPLLSQTGAFTNLATLTPASGLIPFSVNSALWSDGAAKYRWLALPTDGAPYGPNETIKFNATNEWDFPVGTVLVKHFELGVNHTNLAAIKRLETRFLVHATNSSWYGLTYKWRADQSDADLLPAGLLEDIPIQTAANVITQTWQYPSRQDCLTCHNETAQRVLGVKTRQLNGDYHYSGTGITDNQLRTWSHLGLFDAPLNTNNIPGYDKLVEVTNQTAILEHRVRSYLDANCAHCHRPNGVAALFDARSTTPLPQQGLLDGSVVNPLGIPGARIVAPRNPGQSLLHVRDNALGPDQMPPLARNVVDTNYIATLTAWIMSLPLATPANLTAQPTSVSVIQLAWDYPAPAAASYWIERSYDGTNFTVVATNGPGVTSYLDTGLRSATPHHYRVMAVSGSDTSGYSATVLAATLSGGNNWFVQDGDAQGLVVMEAENATANVAQGGKSWNTNLTAGHSGPAALQALPNTGVNNNTGYTTSSPRLDFQVQFPQPGTHYVWIRGLAASGADDSCHAGLNGSTVASSDRISGFGPAWTWSKTTLDSSSDATFIVNTAGVHTVNVWMREDGFVFDKLLLTRDANYNPGTGVGPAESARTGPILPPILSPIASVAIDEDTQTGVIPFSVSDAETHPDNLILSVQSLNPILLPHENVVVAGVGTNRSLALTPTPNQFGTAVVAMTLSDGYTTVSNWFTLTVNPVNDPPFFVNTLTNRTVWEHSLLTVVNPALDIDNPAPDLSYTLLNPPPGALISSNGVITWTPEEAQGPSTNTIWSVVDDGVASVTNSFVVTVLEVNTAPEFAAPPPGATIDELTMLVVTNAASDSDLPSNLLTYQLLDAPLNAAIDGNGVISWTPSEAQGPSTNTIWTVVDDGMISVTNSFVVTVLEVNAPPAANPDALARFASQGVSTSSANLLANDVDPEGDALTLFTLLSATPSGSVITNSDGVISYQPVFGDTNMGGFSYVVADGKGGMATGLVTIAVLPDPPAFELLGLQTGSGQINLSFTGVPGFTYTVLYTDTFQPPNWQRLGVAVASETGLVQMVDASPEATASRYYRAVRGVMP